MYIIYKTTNLFNNRYYIGVHQTDDINDKYLGSGKILKESIKKYGRENFKRDILFIFNTIEEAYEKEKELVNDDFILDDSTYNLVGGGSISISFKRKNILSGDKHPMWGKKTTKESNEKRSKTLSITNQLPEVKERRINGGKVASLKRKLNGYSSPMKGKNLTDEDKKNKSIAALNVKKVICPHCNKKIDPGNGKLWHFDKCKLRF